MNALAEAFTDVGQAVPDHMRMKLHTGETEGAKDRNTHVSPRTGTGRCLKLTTIESTRSAINPFAVYCPRKLV